MSTISECISASNQSIKAVGDNFLSAIKCSGIVNADFASIFEVKQDFYTINALSEYQKEKCRVEQEIEKVKQSINKADATVSDLNAKIRYCDSLNYSAQIRSAANDMDYYRRAMNRASDARSRDDAQSQYRSAQREKENAEANQRTNSRNRAEYVDQKNSQERMLDDFKSQKHDLNKRLDQVTEIINLF